IHFGERAWWLGIFLVFVSVAAWVYGEFVQRGTRHRVVAAITAIVVLAVGYAWAIEGGLRWRDPIRGTAAASVAPETAAGDVSWRPWSLPAIAQVRSERRPV